ncbi:MAG: FAD-binding oxidoreductase [Bacteroidota bacterium]|nr:FAD-binding oxidoreductase [Bacteroidota bacterium]MDP4230073.1 FAD-binding oxidoreductase [Bacteroidota bacterium]MDP4235742.1 FAD-binding oxidoreductase [Bacteroidota bacterium]
MAFTPNSHTEVSDFLRKRKDLPLHISGNDADRHAEDTISLSKLNSVVLYEPEEMIISVGSGIPLTKLENILVAKGQWIPTLCADESLEQTLGAAIAMDHFHPRSLSSGALRTTILGGTFCTTSGEIFKSGSRVVKSVAGYDIHRSFCGSQGRFGVILDLTLKVQPRPEEFFRFLAPLDSKQRLVLFHPTCLEEFDGKLLVEFAGYSEDVSYDRELLKSEIMMVEELSDSEWVGSVRKMILLRDAGRKAVLSPVAQELLMNVRKVFDPKGVLV